MHTNSRLQLMCAWAGPGLAVFFGLGFVGFAGFVPPPAPSMSAGQVAAMFRDHATAIRTGMVFCQLGMTLWCPFGISIAMQTRRAEKGKRPVMTVLQVSSVAVCTSLVVSSTCLWEAAAFRAGNISPEITQALNDLSWFVFLWPILPFSLWISATAIPILQDTSDSPVYPRWIAYLGLWAAFLFLPAAAIAYFHDGPLSWNGLLGFYVPVIPFFVWLLIMTAYTVKAIKEEQHAGILVRNEEASVI